jgi:AraC-like DNA-binding protein
MLILPQDAYELLIALGAPKRLMIHLQLVGEAAEELLEQVRALGVGIDDDVVRLGAAVHDAGKIIHPNELDGDGSEHEEAGEKLFLGAGVRPAIARYCISHSRYDAMELSLEELLVALSDKLWKGKRISSLELRVIDRVAEILHKDRWDVFSELDDCFERILAVRAGMAERTFHRTFLAATGETPARFVEIARLDAARMLLARGISLKSVAARVGLFPPRAFPKPSSAGSA